MASLRDGGGGLLALLPMATPVVSSAVEHKMNKQHTIITLPTILFPCQRLLFLKYTYNNYSAAKDTELCQYSPLLYCTFETHILKLRHL